MTKNGIAVREKRMWMGLAGGLLLVLIIAFVCGPRTPLDTTLRTVELPDDLDAYLTDSESRFDDILPGVEKTIVWAGERGVKSEFSLVYFHGFSATRQEIAPLCDRLAAELGANLYYPRLPGHGRSAEAMGQSGVNDWLNAGHEALEIGRQMGERVILIGTSTGATLATWLAANVPEPQLAALVLLSPNFRPANRAASWVLLPWGQHLAEWAIGPTRSWEPQNDRQARLWHTTYPTRALSAMMGLVRVTVKSDLHRIQTPTLVVYSPRDQVVSPQAIESTFQRMGPSKKLVPFHDSADRTQHVLAGDIISPTSTDALLALMMDFLQATSIIETAPTAEQPRPEQVKIGQRDLPRRPGG
ncbi:MAG: alpha/beta fold hydrolase [Pseudomonadota bacterium]|nr:alpha/beta fold hydrolase [Pseudomonadota bacterium]